MNENERIPLTDDMRVSRQQKLDAYGNDGLRVLAVAVRDDMSLPDLFSPLDPSKYAEYEHDLSLVGFVGMRDPPRSEVAQAIRSCMDAGVRVVMITGDNQRTAEAICRQVGLFGPCLLYTSDAADE